MTEARSAEPKSAALHTRAGLAPKPQLTAIVAGLALGAAVGYNIANVGPAADVLANKYEVPVGTIGFLTTALFVTHLVMQIPGGKLVDERGARRLGMFALALTALGNLLALLDGSFVGGVLGRLVAGLGTGVRTRP